MKTLLVLTTVLFLAGCGSQQSDILEEPPMFSGVDPQIKTWFDTFTSESGVSTAGISAGFTALPNGIAGECVWGGVYNEVRMDTSYWVVLTNDGFGGSERMKQLVYHELGHCALFLQHINECSDGTTAPDGTISSCNQGHSQPMSIMNWMAFSDVQAIGFVNSNAKYVNALKANQPIGSYP
jgi:hypothetical protein